MKLIITRLLVVVVAFALCGLPEAMQAQDAQSTTQPATTQNPQQQRGNTTVDPSQGPLTPIPTETPQPTAPDQNQVTNPSPAPPQTQPATAQPQRQQEPLGAAAAEGVKTEGGGASRPAGAAIAPAKQRQVRSFLLKFGAIAAAGVAIGTVYALSKGTSSTPPGSGR
jgi:outer membrane biosynthesis protein TonB